MARVSCEVEIAAPVELVWTLMQDPTRRGDWDFRVTGGRFTKEGFPTKGATFTVAGRMLLPFHFDMEYLMVSPYRQTVVRLVQAHGVPVETGTGSWTYIRDIREEGEWTVVRSAFRFEMEKPWDTLIDKWLVAPVMYWITWRSLRRLKKLVERGR